MRALADATTPNSIGQKPFRGKNIHRRINPAGADRSTPMIAHADVARADRNPGHGLPNSLLSFVINKRASVAPLRGTLGFDSARCEQACE